MGLTLRLLPQDSQDMKKIRFSFVSSVSGDLHVLHVTYSTFFWGDGVSKYTGTWSNHRTNVSSKDVLHLFLLESTFDYEATCTINTARSTHFSEQELNDMLRLG